MGRRTFFGVVAFEFVVGGETEIEMVEFEVQRGGLKKDKGLLLWLTANVVRVNGEGFVAG